MARLAESPRMAVRTERDRERVQLDFTDEALTKLKELQGLTGTQTPGELVRLSLRVLDWWMTRKREGYSLMLSKDGRDIKVDLDL